MKVKFRKLSKKAVTPSYAKAGDAGMDLTATSMNTVHEGTHWTQYAYIEYGTDIAVAIPKGFVGLIFPRSSISKTVLSLANAVGVVDSGYRGEIKCRFKYTDIRTGDLYKVGERIAQLIIVPYPEVELEEVEELDETERGEGGFGSTNKN